MSNEAGAEPVNLGIAWDTPEDLERLFRAGVRADLLVSSAGDHDHVRSVLAKLGCRLVFSSVNMKPAIPSPSGASSPSRAGAGPSCTGCPGTGSRPWSPSSRSSVRAPGDPQDLWPRGLVPAGGRGAAGRAPAQEARAAPLRAVLLSGSGRGGDGITARTTANQSSGVLSSMTLAQGLLVFPAEASELAAGGTVRVQVLDPQFFASAEGLS